MPFNSMDDFTFKHSGQLDAIYTQYTASQIKALFDSRGDEIRTALNNLITKLNDINVTSDLKTPQLTPTSGTTVKDQLAYLLQQIGNTALGAIPDGSVNLVKLATEVVNKMNLPINQIGAITDESGNITNINTYSKLLVNAINEVLSSSVVYTATGTGNVIAVTTNANFPYVQGKPIKFKAIADNSGATTINVDSKGAVPLLKLDGSQPTIKNGKVYESYYDATNGGRFFLLARASGNTIPSHVLAGEIFSTEVDTDLVGTAPLKSGITYTPTTSDQVIGTGFEDGTCKVKGDANLIVSNIRKNTSLYGLTGTLLGADNFDAIPRIMTVKTDNGAGVILDVTGGGWLIAVSNGASSGYSLSVNADEVSIFKGNVSSYNANFMLARFNSHLVVYGSSAHAVMYVLD